MMANVNKKLSTIQEPLKITQECIAQYKLMPVLSLLQNEWTKRWHLAGETAATQPKPTLDV